ncbi:protein VACUOLELESS GAMETOPHYTES-like [Actinidia eriantha]|uniref:protein VACUOLELESS GAMETOPHYTES-like n=1 Tax=Actinidia eriantha TaxID=165200 RepID=UPI002584B388|nr:protein VACUOLELESS GAMETOPHYTES-like [Actinidia eriantha]
MQCWQCNFFLHEHCGNANRFIKHPSHPTHPLILLPSPTYCAGAFLCNACGSTGTAFSYSCALCQVDLHLHCAFLPPTVNHKSHPHELDLTDITPDKDNCKLCNKLLDSKYWNYQCLKCVNFRVHTFCATNEVKPGLYLDDEDDSGGSNLNPTGPPQSEDDKAEIVLSEDAVVELIKVGIQMQMAEQLAEMFASGKIN